jgi:LmbE family N-acetylglucosaminyl deacetylase
MFPAFLDFAASSNLIRPRRPAFLCSEPAELPFSVKEKPDILAARQKNLRPSNPDWLGTLRPACLNSLAIPPGLRVAVLAPHPDDFDAAGVTLRLFQRNGNRILLAVLTSGAGGVEDGFCSPPSREGKARIRENEQRASCRFFGLPPEQLVFLRLAEDEAEQLADSEENIQAIRRYLLERAPQIVFLPHGNDTNRDHRLVWSLARRAAYGSGLSVTAFLIRDPKTVAMRADAYTAFGDEEAGWKARLLRFHRSQHQRNLNTRNKGFDDRILGVNRQAALELRISTPYAEAFELECW